MKSKAELMKAIRAASRKDKGAFRLSCKAALLLAAKHRVSPGRIGKYCDEEGVKLRCCQLGCF
ncbi:MAG: hypothetical protein WCO42_04320 [bacterium]